MAKNRKRVIDPWSAIIIFSLVMIDVILWSGIFTKNAVVAPKKYDLGLAKNSSTLIIFPHNVKMIIDAGANDAVVEKMDEALSLVNDANDHYIDLAIISSPQLTSYGGYVYLLEHYSVGAFIYNGRNDPINTKDWSQFLAILQSKKIPLVAVGKGDSIMYDRNKVTIISPDKVMDQSADLNDASLREVFK
jgi:beta-lactamase superfamily II metal-dependent hydrolase